MILEAQGLRRRVKGRTLFENLSFTLAPGERLILTGPSGAGKTVLLRLIAGLDPLEGGEIRFGGKTMEEMGATRWRSRIAYVPQSPPSWPGTPADLLARVRALRVHRLVGEERDPRALSARLGLDGELWDKPFSLLSGGERQRMALALVLFRHPALLLLDEPTASLDEASVARVEAEVGGYTAIWVTHDKLQAERLAGRRLSLGCSSGRSLEPAPSDGGSP